MINKLMSEFIDSKANYDEDRAFPPLLASKHSIEGEKSAVRLFQVMNAGDWIRGVYDAYCAKKDGYFIVFSTMFGQEFVYYTDSFNEALDFFKKLAECVQLSNDICAD